MYSGRKSTRDRRQYHTQIQAHKHRKSVAALSLLWNNKNSLGRIILRITVFLMVKEGFYVTWFALYLDIILYEDGRQQTSNLAAISKMMCDGYYVAKIPYLNVRVHDWTTLKMAKDCCLQLFQFEIFVFSILLQWIIIQCIRSHQIHYIFHHRMLYWRDKKLQIYPFFAIWNSVIWGIFV